MDINTVNNGITKRKHKNRVGRGTGSGNGKTAGRGSNGQGSRAGFSMSPVFEGGQMPLVRRIPKRGFNNKEFADVVESVTLKSIMGCFDGGEVIEPAILLERGLIDKKGSYVKIIGNDELDKAYKFKVHAASKGAAAAVEKAGGSFEYLPKKKPVVKNKMKPRTAK